MNTNSSRENRCIFTIGHSNQPLERLVGLLRSQHIDVLVDVRSYPYSKHAPHFDAQVVKSAVTSAGIKYLFLGKELGGRPKGEEFYDTEGYVLYSRVAESPLFLEGISRLKTGIQNYCVAIMCSEENPAGCHRRLLIGRVLSAQGITIFHIRSNGKVQTEVELTREEASRHRGGDQAALFEKKEAAPWKSIRSVLRREKQQNSLEP